VHSERYDMLDGSQKITFAKMRDSKRAFAGSWSIALIIITVIRSRSEATDGRTSCGCPVEPPLVCKACGKHLDSGINPPEG